MYQQLKFLIVVWFRLRTNLWWSSVLAVPVPYEDKERGQGRVQGPQAPMTGISTSSLREGIQGVPPEFPRVVSLWRNGYLTWLASMWFRDRNRPCQYFLMKEKNIEITRVGV